MANFFLMPLTGLCLLLTADLAAAEPTPGPGRQINFFKSDAEGPQSVHFSADGRRILIIGSDGSSTVKDTLTGQDVANLPGDGNRIVGAALAPDGTRAFTGSFQVDSNFIWDVASGKKLATLENIEEGAGFAEFSRDGTKFLTGSDDTLLIWNAADGRSLARPAAEGLISTAVFSADGLRVVQVSNDKMQVWDAITGKNLSTIAGNDGQFTHASFGPDSSRIVSCEADNTAHIRSLSGQDLMVLAGHGDVVNDAEFSPDGSRIVTASADKTARIWDAATGKEILQLKGHTDGVNTAVFSPDGRLIVTASSDATAKLWDVATGAELATLRGHADVVNQATFSTDGKYVLTTNGVEAGIWDAQTPGGN